jgi:olefin beta-lactone synthetase
MAEFNHNIAAHLPKMARKQPDALAVVVQHAEGGGAIYRYEELTALELEEESNRLAHGLLDMGVGSGTRAVLMVKPSLEFFALTFALFKVGAIPVMVDPGMGIKNLKTCLAEAAPEAFIGITKAHVARVLFGWGKDSISKKVTVGPKLFWGGERYTKIRSTDKSPVMKHVSAETMAAILFTSGSTGIPKGVVYSHAIFNGQVDSLRDNYGIIPGELDLGTFPLFALFGPALGMASVIPDMDASKPITCNPKYLVDAMQAYKTTNMFASPALIEKVGRYGESENVQLSSLKRVISAGAPADPDSLARFAQMLGNDVSVMPSYGATEALPIASITHQVLIQDTKPLTEEGKGLCIGHALGGIDVKIIEIDDGPIDEWSSAIEVPTGTIGEICVSGNIVAREYYKRAESTALAKIQLPGSEDFFHRMGDVGYLDEQGRIWFCGRKAHRVVTVDKTYFTIPCERVFNTLDGVKRTALVDVNGKTVMCVEVDEEGQFNPSLVYALTEIAESFEHTKGIDIFLHHPGFPMDVRHNAKIYREKLSVWAAGQLS